MLDDPKRVSNQIMYQSSQWMCGEHKIMYINTLIVDKLFTRIYDIKTEKVLGLDAEDTDEKSTLIITIIF